MEKGANPKYSTEKDKLLFMLPQKHFGYTTINLYVYQYGDSEPRIKMLRKIKKYGSNQYKTTTVNDRFNFQEFIWLYKTIPELVKRTEEMTGRHLSLAYNQSVVVPEPETEIEEEWVMPEQPKQKKEYESLKKQEPKIVVEEGVKGKQIKWREG